MVVKTPTIRALGSEDRRLSPCFLDFKNWHEIGLFGRLQGLGHLRMRFDQLCLVDTERRESCDYQSFHRSVSTRTWLSFWWCDCREERSLRSAESVPIPCPQQSGSTSEHSMLVEDHSDGMVWREWESLIWVSAHRTNRTLRQENFKEKNVDRSLIRCWERKKTHSDSSDKIRAISASFSVISLASPSTKKVSLPSLSDTRSLPAVGADRLADLVLPTTSYLSARLHYPHVAVVGVCVRAWSSLSALSLSRCHFYQKQFQISQARTDKYKSE